MGRRVMKRLIPLCLGVAALFMGCDGLTSELEEAIIASHDLEKIDLTLQAGSGGSVNPSGLVSLTANEKISITGIPDSGFTFYQWVQVGGSGTPSIGNKNEAFSTVSISGGDVTLQANYTDSPRQLTVNVGTGGSITLPAVSPVTVANGNPYTIVASPNTGYQFNAWSQAGGSGTAVFNDAGAASTTVTVTGGDATIQASFTLRTYSLSVSASGDGTVTNPASSPVTVTHGVSRTISASAPTARGVYFSGWTQTGGSGTAVFGNASSSSTSVTVTGGNVSIQAIYSPINVNITYVATYGLNSSANTSERLSVANDIQVVGNYAYVGGQSPAGQAQILKLDISDIDNPAHYSNWAVASGEVEDMHMVGTTMSVAVSGTAGDLYTFTPTSNFSLSDRGMNEALRKAGGNDYVANTSNHLLFYHSHADWSDLSEISCIDFDTAYNRAYVSGYFDYGYGELHTLRHNSGTESFDDNAQPFSITSHNSSWAYYFYDLLINDIYLYVALDDGGILTLHIDDNPITVEDRDPRTTGSGNPRFLEFGGSNNNYMVSLSYEYNSTNDGRIAVYDIHWENGSQNQPLLLEDRATAFNTRPLALATSGDYIFTIEGSNMVIYRITSSTD